MVVGRALHGLSRKEKMHSGTSIMRVWRALAAIAVIDLPVGFSLSLPDSRGLAGRHAGCRAVLSA
jgi:hypothetical protein